ncbi:hypothetical protein [Amycolatopsis sp. FDAARGOS 1241]|uniref:hypothetical protein n=1 Tax=Amycolatopsis sp. FDAARGOS 1241 TaxID=2778070 RepID=UPI00194DCA4A|nr:hypothetical protein [Amycolatopsis sp. FDAARGOS 1241]QRP49060.1 hypothetical protein I6J71_15435 [Amycolatopsis sp. FDAARGOS 1241]
MLALVAGCNLPTASGASTQDAAPTSSTGDAATELTKLRVTPEDTGAHYNRDDWKHWIGQPAFGKGCDTREMVLIQQGHHDGGGPVVHDPSTCRVASGHGNSMRQGRCRGRSVVRARRCRGQRRRTRHRRR